MPRWLKILLGIVVGIAVVIAVIIGSAMWATSGLLEPVERQLTALKAGDLDAAYAETSQAFQQATSKEQFAAFVEQYPILKEAASWSFPSRSFENNAGKVTGTLTSTTGAVTTVDYDMVYEGGTWKILGIVVTPGGTG
jgi:hypothetical protein